MDWVAEGIAVGGMKDAMDFELLESEGVEAVLQLYGQEREQIYFILPIDTLQLQVEDRRPLPPPLLRRGVKFIRRQRLAERRVLVCCGAGMSRSPSFVAAYLHEEGMDILEAFRQIRSSRPEVHPHRAMVRSLVDYYRPEIPLEELLHALYR
jgi:protein-tyrosine phosphatase